MAKPGYKSLNSSTNNVHLDDLELEDISQRTQEESQNLLMSSFNDIQDDGNDTSNTASSTSAFSSENHISSESMNSENDDSDTRLANNVPLERSNEMIAQHIEQSMRRVPLDSIDNIEQSNGASSSNDNNTNHTADNINENPHSTSNSDNSLGPDTADSGSRLQDFLSNNVVSRSITSTIRNAPILRYLNHNYNPLASQAHTHPFGATNDGVFGNMSAKPTVGQDSNNTATLPTYDEAASDPTPPYWEASIMAGYDDEIFVDGLPVGNWINLIWNIVVSVSFQFIGFVITYLLHTSHAAKEGSRAGLGITLINLGFSSIPMNFGSGDNVVEDKFEPNQPNSYDVSSSITLEGSIDEYTSNLNTGYITTAEDSNSSSWSNSPILAYGSIALGIFITVKALIDYLKAKRTERNIMNSAATPTEQV